MAHQSFFPVLLLSSLLLLPPPLTSATEGSVTLFKLESQSSISGLKVTIQCTTSGAITGNRTFFRARDLDGNDAEIVRAVKGSGLELLLTFELTPKLEGYYFCQVGNLTSNKLPLVAHPVLNRNLRSAAGAGITGPLSVPLRGTVVVPCPYERGTFEERYGVTWFQGVQMINTSDVAQANNRYQVHRNFSLTIQDVMPTDASSAYYCQVHVNTTEGDIITRQSPYVTVEVLDPITILHHLEEQIVAPNSEARYTCKVSGVPMPTITWTFNGAEISEGTNVDIENNNTNLRNLVAVTSTLRYRSSQESGQVACIGYHTEGKRPVMVTSEAHLIVLSDNLTPSLSVTEEGPRLQVQLPSLIPGQFELQAYYNYQSLRSRKLISHPTFRNTREVDIIIPADKLPPFRTFQVQVALSVANKTSGRSTISSQITFDEEFSPTDDDCVSLCPDVEDPEPVDSNTPLVALLAVFVVLLIIVIIVGTIVGILFFVCFRRMKHLPLNKLDETSNGGGHFSAASDGTRMYDDHCASPTSTLQQSRKSSFSSHGGQAGAESSDDNEEENPHHNIDHKMLEQWEEKNKAEAVAMDTMEVDDETGIRMHSNEYHPTRVEHQRRKKPGENPYVTNIAMHRGMATTATTAAVKPTDSFEDLTVEFEKMKKTQSADFSKSA